MDNIFLQKSRERERGKMKMMFVPGIPAVEQFRSGIGWKRDIPDVVGCQ